MTNTRERLEILHDQERRLLEKLTGASRGINRPALSKELASVRRQIAMLTEAEREPMQMPEQKRRFA